MLHLVRNDTDKIPYNTIFQFYIEKILYKTKLATEVFTFSKEGEEERWMDIW